MAISKTLRAFLDGRGVEYAVVPHPRTASANRSAEAAHLPGDRIAKAVLLADADAFHLALVPATRRLRLGRLHHLLGEHVGLATEDEVAAQFPDCTRGAVPALGPAYGLDSLVDESLLAGDTVYLEGGDHESLVRLNGSDFTHLLAQARHGQFSVHI